MNPRKHWKVAGAFTLIELLVVIGIIAIVAGLVVAASGEAVMLARQRRAENERDQIVVAVESYKQGLGFYPPAAPNAQSPSTPYSSPLFYELTGVQIPSFDSSNAPAAYQSRATGVTLTPVQVATVFGVAGFANTTTNFLPVSASGFSGKVSVAGVPVPITFLGVQVTGPYVTNTLDGKQMSPWFYMVYNPANAAAGLPNPANNPTTYDLWTDIRLGKNIYRVSNWSKDPQKL